MQNKYSKLTAIFSLIGWIAYCFAIFTQDYAPDFGIAYNDWLLWPIIIGITIFPIFGLIFTIIAFIKKEQSRLKWTFLILLAVFIAWGVYDFIQHPLGGYFIG